jgi:hypothetical protein
MDVLIERCAGLDVHRDSVITSVTCAKLSSPIRIGRCPLRIRIPSRRSRSPIRASQNRVVGNAGCLRQAGVPGECPAQRGYRRPERFGLGDAGIG